MKRACAVSVAALLLGLVAGCGGGSSDSTNAKGYENIEEHAMVEHGSPPWVAVEIGELLRAKYNTEYGGEETGTDCESFGSGIYHCEVVNPAFGSHKYKYEIEVDERTGEAEIVSNQEVNIGASGPFNEAEAINDGYEFHEGEAVE